MRLVASADATSPSRTGAAPCALRVESSSQSPPLARGGAAGAALPPRADADACRSADADSGRPPTVARGTLNSLMELYSLHVGHRPRYLRERR